VGYTDAEPGILSPQAGMHMQAAWDENYLYLGYEVSDRNLVAAARGEPEGPPDRKRRAPAIRPDHAQDFTEFFVSFEDPRFFWEIHHNPGNDFGDVFCIVPDPNWAFAESSLLCFGLFLCEEAYLKDDGKHTVAYAVHLKATGPDAPASTVNHPSDRDTGYTAELRLPWKSIGAPGRLRNRVAGSGSPPRHPVPGPWRMSGVRVRILAVHHNGDLPIPYFHTAPARSGGWFHQSFPHWPVFLLDGPDAR
jgi:hypothetical protein